MSKQYPKAGAVEIRPTQWKVQRYAGNLIKDLHKYMEPWLVQVADPVKMDNGYWSDHLHWECPNPGENSLAIKFETTMKTATPIKWAVCKFHSSGWFVDSLLDTDEDLEALRKRNPGLAEDDMKLKKQISSSVENYWEIQEKDQNFFDNIP